jgi:hypothetical protein
MHCRALGTVLGHSSRAGSQWLSRNCSCRSHLGSYLLWMHACGVALPGSLVLHLCTLQVLLCWHLLLASAAVLACPAGAMEAGRLLVLHLHFLQLLPRHVPALPAVLGPPNFSSGVCVLADLACQHGQTPGLRAGRSCAGQLSTRQCPAACRVQKCSSCCVKAWSFGEV